MTTSNDQERLLYSLYERVGTLPSSYIKLRSYLNILSASIAEGDNVRLFRNNQKLCPYCYSFWSCDTSSFKLLPSKKLKKIHNKTGANFDVEERVQQSKNTLLVKCKVCTRKSRYSLMKKKIKAEKIQEEEMPVKKKKKKKDKSCGLRLNLRKPEVPSPQQLGQNKKMGPATADGSRIKNPVKIQSESPKKAPVPINKQFQITKSKELGLNKISLKAHRKHEKQYHKLKKLQRAVKGSKDVTKKSFKDFLTLI